MPKFAANLSMMFTEFPFLDRFAAAADAGFKGVEYLFPYEYAPEAVAKRLDDNGLENVLFNMPPGDWGAGERGTASLPGREEEFRQGVAKAISYAVVLGVRRLHAMAGIPPAGADPVVEASSGSLAFTGLGGFGAVNHHHRADTLSDCRAHHRVSLVLPRSRYADLSNSGFSRNSLASPENRS